MTPKTRLLVAVCAMMVMMVMFYLMPVERVESLGWLNYPLPAFLAGLIGAGIWLMIPIPPTERDKVRAEYRNTLRVPVAVIDDFVMPAYDRVMEIRKAAYKMDDHHIRMWFIEIADAVLAVLNDAKRDPSIIGRSRFVINNVLTMTMRVSDATRGIGDLKANWKFREELQDHLDGLFRQIQDRREANFAENRDSLSLEMEVSNHVFGRGR